MLENSNEILAYTPISPKQGGTTQSLLYRRVERTPKTLVDEPGRGRTLSDPDEDSKAAQGAEGYFFADGISLYKLIK